MRMPAYRYSAGGAFPFFASLSRAVKFLLIANVASYILGLIIGRSYVLFFGLVPESVLSKFYFWQPVTYLFLHGGFLHLLFNMFALWMFGSELEYHWGSRYFVKFYFLTGIGAGIITLLLSQTPHVPTIGASGAIFAVLMAFALTFPNRLILLYFLIPIKAKYLIGLFFIVEFFASFRYVNDGIGHITHLGGMIIAYFYLRWGNMAGSFFDTWKKRKARRRLGVVRRDEEERERFRIEVDRILDKIGREGIERLTSEERETLERASRVTQPGQNLH
jgi:membrane associated rhomboid family serine protease